MLLILRVSTLGRARPCSLLGGSSPAPLGSSGSCGQLAGLWSVRPGLADLSTFPFSLSYVSSLVLFLLLFFEEHSEGFGYCGRLHFSALRWRYNADFLNYLHFTKKCNQPLITVLPHVLFYSRELAFFIPVLGWVDNSKRVISCLLLWF